MKLYVRLLFSLCTLLFTFENMNSQSRCKIYTIDDFSSDYEFIDSHEGDEKYSVLQPIAKYLQLIPPSALGINNPVYPRIKRCKDGSYILFYHNSRIGSTIYYTKSNDLLEWDNVKVLFSPTEIIDSIVGIDKRKYSTADATVLNNGDIISYASYRSDKHYRYRPDLNGIMMRRSHDNGKTWGDEETIYIGTNWEPFVLQLPDGILQCYFTDTEPLNRNSGTSIILSDDNGYSWYPSTMSQAYPVVRQYKYDNNDSIFTDQMPCFRLLNDGVTLLGFLERSEERRVGKEC